MGDYFRHKASGDALTVLFQYHKDQADLKVTVLDTAKRVQGKGRLASYSQYVLRSDNEPELSGSTLYVGGANSPNNIGDPMKETYSSVVERNNALFAFCTMIDQVCGNAPGTSVPGFLGGVTKCAETFYPVEEMVEIKIGGMSMFGNVTKNTLTSNLVDSELVVEIPGLSSEDVSINQPAGKDTLLITYTKDDKKMEPIPVALAKDTKVSNISASVVNGVLKVKVNYDLGSRIEIANE